MKNVMTKAWEIAREGQNKFGGKVSEYLSEAMKLAWEFFNTVGSDDCLMERVKESLVYLWKENKEMFIKEYGTCAVFIKVTINNRLNVREMNDEKKIKLSETLVARGF